MQQHLWLDQNPLQRRFGPEYFRQIPQQTGVYCFTDRRRRVLFVGRCKNLQHKLKSYCLWNSETTPAKKWKLLSLVRDIRWKICHNDLQASRIELEWINLYQPPFNNIFERPEALLYWGFTWEEKFLELRLRRSHDDLSSFRVFGPFRGHKLNHRALGALVRLLWQALYQREWHQLPQPLCRQIVASDHRIETPFTGTGSTWQALILAYLGGYSDHLVDRMLASRTIADTLGADFGHKWLEQDGETLREFFIHGPGH